MRKIAEVLESTPEKAAMFQ